VNEEPNSRPDVFESAAAQMPQMPAVTLQLPKMMVGAQLPQVPTVVPQLLDMLPSF